MDLRRNSLLYSLPIVMFVAGIFIGTAGIWRSAYLYKQTICYLPAVHLQIKQAGFPSGFLKYVCRLRLPVFLMIAVSALTNAAPAAFAAIAFISGVSAAVVITSATMLFGITGILQALALFLPHFIFYIFGYWALYELAYKRSEFRLGANRDFISHRADMGCWDRKRGDVSTACSYEDICCIALS